MNPPKIYRNVLNLVHLSTGGEVYLKGKTICPECKHEFVLDVPDDRDKHDAVCPKCSHKFTIKTKSCKGKPEEDCSWEEHGEPRKTILSSIKPLTRKPVIAAILLAAVFALGITTAAFSETFVETSLEVLSNTGVTGTVEFFVIDQSNETLENVEIIIDDISGATNESGIYIFENVTLGIQNVEISLLEYKTQIHEILVVPVVGSYNKVTMEEGIGEDHTAFDILGCSIILVIFSVFALLGSFSCLKRRNLDVAIAGSAIGIFVFGFFMIGSLLSIIALIMIIMSKEEFENGKKGKVF